MTKAPIYQFDNVQVELGSFRVLKAGAVLALEPKAFEVLVYLIQNRERLIEKNELIDAVWKETFVTPNAMTRVIAQLRKALGDDAREARYIETVPTRGYRFIATVDELDGPKAVSLEKVKNEDYRKPRRLAPAAAFVALGIVVIISVFSWRSRDAADTSSPSGTSKLVQITTWSGLDIFPSLSRT